MILSLSLSLSPLLTSLPPLSPRLWRLRLLPCLRQAHTAIQRKSRRPGQKAWPRAFTPGAIIRLHLSFRRSAPCPRGNTAFIVHTMTTETTTTTTIRGWALSWYTSTTQSSSAGKEVRRRAVIIIHAPAKTAYDARQARRRRCRRCTVVNHTCDARRKRAHTARTRRVTPPNRLDL